VTDLAWWSGVVAGLGWGLFAGFLFGVRWIMGLVSEERPQEKR